MKTIVNIPGSSETGAGVTPITPSEARNYFKNYLSVAQKSAEVIKGFTIDLSQLEAMNNLIKENPGLSGFRIYLGRDDTSKKVGIVLGVDKDGKDAVTSTIYNTDSLNLSPCPPICDVNSPISKD